MHSNLIKQALELNATSKTVKYFLKTKEFEGNFEKYINTCKAIIIAANTTSFVSVDGVNFKVSEYEVPKLVESLSDQFNVYLNESAVRDGKPIFKSQLEVDDNVGLMSPILFKHFQDSYNENQGDKSIPCSYSVTPFKYTLLSDLGPVVVGDDIFLFGSSTVEESKEVLGHLVKYNVPEFLCNYARHFTKMSERSLVECLKSEYLKAN